MEDVAWCGIVVRVYLAKSIGFEKLEFEEIEFEKLGFQDTMARVAIEALKKKFRFD